MLRRASRGTIVLFAGLAALIAGILVFTALGLGLGQTDDGPLEPVIQGTTAVLVPGAQKPGRVGRSESIGQRENVGGGDPDAPVLAEQVPFTPKDFDRPIAAYRVYAKGQARRLRGETAVLTAAIESGDRQRARAAWRTAFARYLRLGAVYGAFGELDTAIDGRPGGLPRGDADPGFTGLHRLEKGLWTAEPVSDLAPLARRLQRDAGRLDHAINTAEIEPVDYAIRAHEILEGAQRDFLSGSDVKWSREGVLATASGVAATDVVLHTLHPLLKGQQSQPATQAAVARLNRTLAGLRAAHGGRLPTLDELSRRERQRLIGSLGWALEQLQALPGSLETFDPPPIPKLPTK